MGGSIDGDWLVPALPDLPEDEQKAGSIGTLHTDSRDFGSLLCTLDASGMKGHAWGGGPQQHCMQATGRHVHMTLT